MSVGDEGWTLRVGEGEGGERREKQGDGCCAASGPMEFRQPYFVLGSSTLGSQAQLWPARDPGFMAF